MSIASVAPLDGGNVDALSFCRYTASKLQEQLLIVRAAQYVRAGSAVFLERL